MRDPIAFLSYVRSDDQHDSGRLTQFRERLSGEVRIQTGEAFEIFQDRDIKWGQQWEERLEGTLDAVTFLIPIITPSFFKSDACRKELERFLERERCLGRTDLILPIYYIDCPTLNNPSKREQDPLAKTIATRQYIDWRELRFESSSSPDVGKRFANIAKQIVDALERSQAPSPTMSRAIVTRVGTTQPTDAESETAQPVAVVEASERMRGPEPKTEVPTLVVDALHRGHHSTLTDALKVAKPGTRILVRPGLYQEGVVIEKQVEIVGDGDRGDIVFKAFGKNVVLFKSSMGRISNLTLHQTGGGGFYGIDISQGRLDLEDCDISSQGLACVAIHSGADPRLRRNRISNGNSAGIFVYENGLGTLEENEICGNAKAGVEIKEGGNPTMRRNRIYDGISSGIIIHAGGLGVLEDNDISGNRLAGVTISTGGNPTLRRNRIHDGKQGGVFVTNNGLGTLDDNDIYSNEFAGIEISKNANPTILRNRIYGGMSSGVVVLDGGYGTLEDNSIFDNKLAGVTIRTDGNPTLRRNRIHDGRQGGVFVHTNGLGTIDDNDIYSNEFAGIEIANGANPTVRRNRIYDGKTGGVYVHTGASGTFEHNEIFNNTFAGVEIKTGAIPTVCHNHIHDGKGYGVLINIDGLGTLEDNRILRNATGGIEVNAGGHPTLRKNLISKNEGSGIFIQEGGGGIFEANDLRHNEGGAWEINAECESKIQRQDNVE